MPSNHLILCCPLLLLPSIFPSIRVFSNESVLHIRWSVLCTSPSNEYLGLISFMIDWFDLLAAQGTLRSFLQRHSLKTSVIWPSAFFIIQLSYLIHWRRHRLSTPVFLCFPLAQLVKNPPAMWEISVQSLGWENPLEEGMATHSSYLTWRIPWTVWDHKESDTTK